MSKLALLFLMFLSFKSSLIPVQERNPDLDRQDIETWKITLKSGDWREKAAIVSKLERAAQDKHNNELIRENFLSVIAEELQNIDQRLNHPSSQEALYVSAEWLVEYKAELLSLLTKIADESAIEVLVDHLRTGKGVADSLARIGMPAVPAILRQMKKDPQAIIPACFALEDIAEKQLEQGDEENLRIFRNRVLPTLEQLEGSVSPNNDIVLKRLQKTIHSLREIAVQARWSRRRGSN